MDIQGVGDLYTDPQIHSEKGTDFGDGNLGIFHLSDTDLSCRVDDDVDIIVDDVDEDDDVDDYVD